MLAPVLNLFCVSPLPQDFPDAPNRSGTDFLALDVGLGAETRFQWDVSAWITSRGLKPACVAGQDLFAVPPFPGENFPCELPLFRLGSRNKQTWSKPEYDSHPGSKPRWTLSLKQGPQVKPRLDPLIATHFADL